MNSDISYIPSPLDGMLGRKHPFITVGNRPIGEGFPTYVIAEIGINHNGDIEKAKRLIDIAADCGVDTVKFQKRTLEKIYQQKVLDDPNHYEEGFTYLIPILKEVEFGKEQYQELYAYTKQKGMDFMCTPFDEEAVDFLEEFDLPAYKVASADLTNLILLEKLVGTKKPLILSTGMSTLQDIDYVGNYLRKWGVECILLHCVSAYPTPINDTHLNFMKVLKDRYGIPVGFSSHEIGIDVTLAAVAAGACVIERHITLDKRLEGPDHTSSLEPEQLKTLMQKIRMIDAAKGSTQKQISRIVIRTKETLGKSLMAKRDIKIGEPVVRSMVCAKGPGKGLSPIHLYELLGKTARRDIQQDDYFLIEDCKEDKAVNFVPQFDTFWGFKGRFKDLDVYQERYQPKFVEIHLNDRDVEYPFEEFHYGKKYPFEIFLHYPTYWHRSVVNLASEDEEERKLHLQVVQKVVDLARRIGPYFQGEPKVVVHFGGMDIYEKKNNKHLIELAYDSMRRLNCDGVTFYPENNPPRPWYFAGQWYDNAFCSAKEMVDLCKEFNLKMCFDASHAKLYTNVTGEDYWDYVKAVAPYTNHLHVSDAYGIDGEGVQIGDGEIDFQEMFRLLDQYGDLPGMSWTPEIWQGHNHNYQGFLIGFERLSSIPELKPLNNK